MGHDHPLRSRFAFLREKVRCLGLQIGRVELEIGRPAPAGILVAIDHRPVVGLKGLDEEYITAWRRWVRAGVGVGPEQEFEPGSTRFSYVSVILTTSCCGSV